MQTPNKEQKSSTPPFLKWAGGKRWLLNQIEISAPEGLYIEPFVGSAAVFFHMQPKRALLSDVNRDLIEVYASVRDYPEEIGEKLKWHQARHSSEHYYKVRETPPKSTIDKSVRFIYLNRTCWNGLYRVNKSGQFNVPIGTKTNVVMASDCWKEISSTLKFADLKNCDFEESLCDAKRGDLVFADPPYTVKHNLNGFVKYNESIFTWEDQIRLRDSLLAAAKRGAKIILTNAAHASVKELYDKDFQINTVRRASILAGKSSARGTYEEFLITADYA